MLLSSAPALIVFQLLELCNLRCTMCYEWGEAGSFHDKETLASLDVDVVLNIINDCVSYKPAFEFFGGEPLLYPKLWQVIQQIRANGCELSFSTNGTLLEKYAQQLVENAPTRLWVSLDGPLEINNRQRGRGVFERAIAGLNKVSVLKALYKTEYPTLGITYVVTPANAEFIEDFFLRIIDLGQLGCVSIELQSYLTETQNVAYKRLLADKFGVIGANCGTSYLRDISFFESINSKKLVQQITQVAKVCEERGIFFHCQPNVMSVENVSHYFSARWQHLAEYKTRCAMPWLTAEISARGEVSTCHSFYDLSLGNVYQDSLLNIWRGERMKQWRDYVRTELLPVCTACCRYYSATPVFPELQTNE